MTDVARREYDNKDLEMFEAIGLRPNDPKARAAVAIARRYDLDPVMKHVVVIPQAGPYITRDGYLFHAQRTGQLIGMDEVEAPEVVEVEGMGKVWRSKVAVYRKGHSKPYAFYGYFPVGRRGNEHKMARKDSERTGLIRAFGLTDVGGDDHYDGDALW